MTKIADNLVTMHLHRTHTLFIIFKTLLVLTFAPVDKILRLLYRKIYHRLNNVDTENISYLPIRSVPAQNPHINPPNLGDALTSFVFLMYCLGPGPFFNQI